VTRAHVVVIEDEPAIRRGVVDALRLTGYAVTEVAEGRSAAAVARQDGVDLVLLDLLLPGRDGLDVLAELRRNRPTLPVIVLTARGGEDDRVRGLQRGADDYVVKPFSARELLARVEAVLRRSQRTAPEITQARLDSLTADLPRRELIWDDGRRADLSDTEVAMLQYLLQHRDRAVSREELLGRVWGVAAVGLETRSVDMMVVRLRSKLADPGAIATVRGCGYMLGTAWEIL
jgi:DNA-binding response OmpR family regulator